MQDSVGCKGDLGFYPQGGLWAEEAEEGRDLTWVLTSALCLLRGE